jgi:DNA-binding PucR family transcriptional regulator
MRCDEHLAETLLAGSPGVAAALAERRLAPLAALKAPQRRRLEDTLAAWLDHPGQPQTIARRLGLHVQTVRYRLRSLRAVLGDEAIDDPRARFELQLALRAQASQ